MPESILVVDDHAEVHELINIIVLPLSVEVRHAYDGRGALEALQVSHPGLIILDLTMPGMNGFELLEHLAANDSAVNIPVMIYSAIPQHARLNNHEWPAQVTDVIEKARVRPSELRERIADALQLETASKGV